MLVNIKKNNTLYVFIKKNDVNLFLTNESVLMETKIYFRRQSIFLHKKRCWYIDTIMKRVVIVHSNQGQQNLIYTNLLAFRWIILINTEH